MIIKRYSVIFFGGFRGLSQGATLRGLSGQSAGGRKMATSFQSSTGCGATPPSLSGGCDLACNFLKAAEAGSLAVLGEVPVVGNFLADAVGLFWPSGTDDAEHVLNETLQYIDGKIADAESDSLLKNIKADYQSLADNVNTLVQYMQDNETSDERFNYLDGVILNGDCTHLRNKIKEYGPKVNPITLLAATVNVGQVCLSMRVAEIYHYNSTVGGAPQPNLVTTFKTKLDSWVQDYMDLAGNATEQALAWRMSMIESYANRCSGEWSGKLRSRKGATSFSFLLTCLLCLSPFQTDDSSSTQCSTCTQVCKEEKLPFFCARFVALTDALLLLFLAAGTIYRYSEGIKDNACFAAAGPPPDMANIVGDSGVCVCDDWFSAFVAYYQSIAIQSFTDNLLPASRSLVPLWKYQTSENMDAGIKPTPVIRAATSIVDAYVKLDLNEDDEPYTFPAAEMAEIYDVYNGAVSQGQRADRITEVTLWMATGINIPLDGVTVSQVISGESKTLQIGMGTPTDDYNDYTWYTLTLEENERIIAVGATDCGDPNFDADGTCLSLGYAFKTAYVDENGAFASEGRLWNPMSYPEDGPWIVAPPLAQSRNNTFLPHVIAFHGWTTFSFACGDGRLGAKVPVWLYESLE
jgi:hypothetical protein